MKLQRVQLYKLFGDRNVTIDLSDLPSIAYIYGENGSGKSTLLRFLAALFDPTKQSELMLSFEIESAVISFSTKESLKLVWKANEDSDAALSPGMRNQSRMLGQLGRGSRDVHFTLTHNDEEATGVLKWKSDALLQSRELRRIIFASSSRFERDHEILARQAASELGPESFQQDWDPRLTDFFNRISAVYIGTERIAPDSTRTENASEAAAKNISQYIEREVAKQGRYTNQKSIEHLGRLMNDVSVHGYTPSEHDLTEIIRETLLIKSELSAVGLLDDEEGKFDNEVDLLSRMHDSTLRDAYIPLFYELYKEVRSNLGTFEKPKRRIMAYRDMLNEKLERKKVAISAGGGLRMADLENENIPFEYLSSGEQHLLVLYHMLIFQDFHDKDCNLVLIDEPELSLNFSWLRQFTDDLEKIIAINGSQFVLATHSPFIASGRPELREMIACDFIAKSGI